MAERKRIKKKTPAKKTTARSAAKKPAKALKKPAAKKKSPAKKAASAAAPPKQVTPAKPMPKPVATPAPRPPTQTPPPPQSTGTITADEVVLGHVMALRPRIHVGFKPSAFADAKRVLAEDRYATIEEAARAVAEKAIEISNDLSRQDPFSRR